MDLAYLTRLLDSVRSGELDTTAALHELRYLPYEDLGFARIDHFRSLRTGIPEVVLGASKTPEQIAAIVERLAGRNDVVLCTRTTAESFAVVRGAVPHATYHETARLVVVRRPDADELPALPGIVLLAAGTGDLPVAEEAGLTAEALGHTVTRIYDVGVAGLHRLMGCLETLHEANAVIVVAGMDGALPSVVGGLVSAPVIAVPTSVGYGANLGGIAPLLTMLNTCALGVAVVNIDNGVGAGVMAASINRRAHAPHEQPDSSAAG